MRGRLRGERGAILVTVALFLPVLVLFLVFVLDVGNWWTHKRHLQVQADAGALAGALGPWLPACDAAAIETNARQYSGDETAGLYNKLSTFTSNHGAVSVSTNSSACSDMYLDVTATETDLPLFFGGLIPGLSVVPTIRAHARVEIKKVKQEENVRPIAVRDDSAYQCAQALFVDDSTGAVLQTVSLPARTPVDSSIQFTNPGGTPVTTPSNAHLGLRVRLGDCAQSTDTFADPTGGVNFINVYSTGADPGSGAPPVVRSVTLPPPLSNCSPDPYFFTNACGLTVKAYVSFQSGAIPSGPSQNVFVKVNGQNATAGSDGGGTYWLASFSVATEAGPQAYTVDWEQQFGKIGSTTCKKNGNPKACKGTFGVQQRAYAATDDDTAPSNSGALRLVQIGESGQSTLGANSFPRNETHTLVVVVRVRGLSNSLPTDPPIVLRFPVQGSKRTGVVDCGQGNGADEAYEAVVNGCPRPIYIWPVGTPCVTPSSSPDGTPIDCVEPVPGNRRQKIARAFADRIGNACNNWNAYRDSGTPIPAGDPRAVTMIITSPANLSGNQGGPPIPVIGLATFYVTGWDGASGSGSGCDNEPFPGSGSDKFAVWGHWIKYVQPGGVGSDERCDPNEFGDCVAVLTE